MAVLDLGLRSFRLTWFETGRSGLLARRSWGEASPLVAAAAPSPAAIGRAMAAVHRLLRELARVDAACPLVAMASGSLVQAGGAALVDELRGRHGIPVEVVSGEGEARLSYLGASMYLGVVGRLAVADLSGASLELATGTGGECDAALSVPLGVLALRGAYVAPECAVDRVARERVAATVRFGAAEAARAVWDRRPDRLAFTGGVAVAVGALADEVGLRQPGTGEISCAALARLADVLAQFQPVDLPGLGPAAALEERRSDAIAVAAVVLHTVMELLGFGSAVISPIGRSEGAAVGALGRAGALRPEGRSHSAVT